MQYDTDLTTDELEESIAAIAPEWRLRDATATAAGHHAVYRVTVETPAGERPCYLKATPPGKDPTVDLEARLLAAIGRHTEIPVPTVIGAVDEHDDLPAPFHLTTAMPGEVRSRTALDTIADETLEAIARDVGEYLAELHRVDRLDGFGFLEASGPTLRGEAPAGDLDAVAVADPSGDWQARLHDWADGTIDRLADTRFADVAPDAEPVLRERIDALEGPFDPALARVDQALENGLLADGRLTAMLDWEFTLAATPAYDICCVAWSLAGGPYRAAPDVSDRRDLVRESVLAGYRARSGEPIDDRVAANRDCYDLLAALRSMVHLEDWHEQFDLGDRIEPAAHGLRRDVTELL